MGVTAESQPPPELRNPAEPEDTGGRPEHTVVSILVLLLLSAGALYGVAHVVQEHNRVVREWDFTQPAGREGWSLPPSITPEDGAPADENDVSSFLMTKSGFGPRLEANFDAAGAPRILATVSVEQADTGLPVNFALGWYWAREEDVKANPEAPFSVDRSMVFRAFARHLPHTYRANAFQVPNWNGTVEMGIFTLKFPPGAEGPFRVRFSRVEFVE